MNRVLPLTGASPRTTPTGLQGLVVAAIIVAWLCALAGLRPLALPDEGRYAGVALEMLRSGDWLTPRLDGLPFFHKPPLFYWLTAAALDVLGTNAFAARGASLLAAAVSAWAAYRFAQHAHGEAAARRVLAVLLVQPLFYGGAQFANLDMLVAACIGLAIMGAARAVLAAESGEAWHGWMLGAHAAVALGVLAKGLIGALLPALVIGTWLLATRRLRRLPMLLWWPAVLLSVVLAVPWFAAMQARHPDFGHFFFIVQHVERFAAGGFNNVHPFWFYPVVLAIMCLPTLPWLWQHAAPGSGMRPDPRGLRLLMRLWAAIVVVFFSIPQSKLVGYVLPAMVPLAFLMADGYDVAASRSKGARRAWQVSLAASAAIGIVGVVALAAHPPASTRDLAAALAARHQADEPVYLLDRYDYDVPFYAGLSEPMRVVSSWSDPDIMRRDNWRRELAEGARFDPVSAGAALVQPAELSHAWCDRRVSWVLGPTEAVARWPVLATAERVAMKRGQSLWRVARDDAATATTLDCAGTPNGGSGGR